MKIVESVSDFNLFLEKELSSVHFIIPIYKGTFKSLHEDDISLLYVSTIDGSNEYILCFNHSEGKSLDISLLKTYLERGTTTFCYNKKRLLKYCSEDYLIDIDLVNWFYTNTYLDQDYETSTHEFFYRKFEGLSDINIVIPISKHYDKCRKIREQFFNVLDYCPEYTLPKDSPYGYYDFILKQLYQIESNGLHVDKKLYNNFFEDNLLNDSLVYTEYNIFTTTGRPSNRFNGVNYAALNKENGCRAAFISRFKNGILVQFDYDAYHLRLLADLLDYKFPENISVHEYLGKMYFGKEELSEEEYQESKQISFKLLYGGITKDYLSVDFFAKIKQYTDLLWEKFESDGYIESPLAGRQLHKKYFTDINPSKLLNYFIQVYETERNLSVISSINELLQTNENKLILYTYDSFLFDMSKYDPDLIDRIQNILQQNNKFPIKLTKGSNFNDVE